MRKLTVISTLVLLLSAFNSSAKTDEFDDFSSSLKYAQVIKVTAIQRPNKRWCFNTTVRHEDQGWDHYADGWEVIDLDGNQLGERPLAHPHDKEQPFTRSQCGIAIPDDVIQVIVRARCNKHGFGGRPVKVNLNQPKGKGFTVKWA